MPSTAEACMPHLPARVSFLGERKSSMPGSRPSPRTSSGGIAHWSWQYGKWDSVNYRATLPQQTGIRGRFLHRSCPGPDITAIAPVEKVLGGASLIFHFRGPPTWQPAEDGYVMSMVCGRKMQIAQLAATQTGGWRWRQSQGSRARKDLGCAWNGFIPPLRGVAIGVFWALAVRAGESGWGEVQPGQALSLHILLLALPTSEPHFIPPHTLKRTWWWPFVRSSPLNVLLSDLWSCICAIVSYLPLLCEAVSLINSDLCAVLCAISFSLSLSCTYPLSSSRVSFFTVSIIYGIPTSPGDPLSNGPVPVCLSKWNSEALSKLVCFLKTSPVVLKGYNLTLLRTPIEPLPLHLGVWFIYLRYMAESSWGDTLRLNYLCISSTAKRRLNTYWFIWITRLTLYNASYIGGAQAMMLNINLLGKCKLKPKWDTH